MRWKKGRRSSNIEDRRGMRMGRGAAVGGGVGILAVVAAMVFGVDPALVTGILGGGQQSGQVQQQPTQQSGQYSEAADFASVVLADTEDTWNSIFKTANKQYQAPKMVLYSGMVQSACGTNSSAAGPFYCPGDYKVYLDLEFLDELKRLGAHGDFSVAYVIAHEIGHHVQNLIGASRAVREVQNQVSRTESNALSVMTELQADCFAGVWAHHAHKQRQVLEQGDIQEGLGAAAAVGDDRLQKMSGRGVHPESFTHGTSEQRQQWFLNGLQSGELATCNTFAQAS
ncbi:MAG: neutral zinc metallopeptidase [Gammaproteobacteria bacterium]|nr:neutral zinc metallopeptidase [Gammaproteobacteria bacterium]